MVLGVLLLSLPALALLLVAVLVIRWGARARRKGARLPAWLAFAAAAGTIGFAVMSASFFWLDMQYGVIALPILALLGAGVWNVLLMVPAAAIARYQRRRAGTAESLPSVQTQPPPGS